jgi:membrane protein implicated in regulation of membrane protease activity
MDTNDSVRNGGWRDRIPLPGMFVVFFVLWFGGQWVAGSGRRSLPVELVGSAVFALVATVLFGRMRHRLHARGRTVADAIALQRTLRQGRLPDDPGQRAAAPQALRRLRRTSWIIVIGYPVLFGGLFAMSLWFLVTGPDRAQWGLFAVVFGLLLAGGMFFGVRWLHRTRDLDRRLAAEQGSAKALGGNTVARYS